ncbi:hypothetical protein DID88_007311 [Monilinia fructigena]|uniref:Uncharacterized protein n=1 Tax=Monilinia fructigena TaxID=38457 RepID=A0A395JAC7_9HELO|nr:hypothetical protein DID88_007311 [Monilinia fructigena]
MGMGKYSARNDDDNDNYHDEHGDKVSAYPSVVLVTKTAWTQITNTAWTTQTATAWTTQTATILSSSVMTVVVPTPTSTLSCSTSSSVNNYHVCSSTNNNAIHCITQHTKFRAAGRKGVCTLANGAPCESGSATTSTVTAYEAIGANSAPTAQADESSSPSGIPSSFHGKHSDDGDLSPLAEKFLISAGSIGPPPSYTSGPVSQNGYPIDEKFSEREMAGYYNPDNKVALERPGSASVNSRRLRTDLQRQNSSRSTQSGMGMSPSPVAGPGQSYSFPSNAEFYYSQSGTLRSQQSGLSGQSSNAYDPSQREVNHISYLSSISSGFGDSLVMPDDSAPPQNPVSRFSWTTASQGAPQNRDTIYTTTSEDTAPRFRTVNSWVAQQTGRVERKKQSDIEIPAMPEIPISYTYRSQVPYPLFTEGHQRKGSENPAFRHHPVTKLNLEEAHVFRVRFWTESLGSNQIRSGKAQTESVLYKNQIPMDCVSAFRCCINMFSYLYSRSGLVLDSMTFA